MPLCRSTVSALVLFVGGTLLAPEAMAWDIQPGLTAKLLKDAGHEKISGNVSVVVDNDPNNEVDSVELRLSSDGGTEDLILTESDAYLHGSAAFDALPAKDEAITLTLYDKGSASLIAFSGTLAADGTVALGEGKSAAPCEVFTKLGCSSTVDYDVEVLAAEVFPADKGYSFTLDLAGADTYEVAYATVRWGYSGEIAKAEMNVDFRSAGTVWTGTSTLDHAGVIDVKAMAFDGEGNTVENTKAELVEPWLDDGDGVNALSAGSGTSVAVTHYLTDRFSGGHVRTPRMTVVSDGWTATEYPTEAELELAGGGTVVVPANSYQRTNNVTYPVCGGYVNAGERDRTSNPGDAFFGISSLSIALRNGAFELNGVSPADLTTPVCSSGTCVVLVEGDKGYELAATSYGTDPGKLPDKQEFDVVVSDKTGAEVVCDTVSVTYAAEVTAVFAAELELAGDPIGGDASGSLKLNGKRGSSGKEGLLVVGTFYGSFSRDSDGDLALGGYGADDWATSESSASAALGDPVKCGGEGCDGDWAPPVVEYRRIAAYVVAVSRVSKGIKLQGSY